MSVIAIANMSNRFCLFKLEIILRRPASVLVLNISLISFQDFFSVPIYEKNCFILAI